MPFSSEVMLIQSFWRLYRTQKKHRKPKTPVAHSFSTLISGNESPICFANEHERTDPKFALVGCSGLKSLVIIKELLGGNVSISSPDGIQNIPRLFIIDTSPEVSQFWRILKKLAIESLTLEEFKDELDVRKSELIKCCRKQSGLSPEIILLMQMLGLTNGENDSYSFMRHIIINTTVILHDWTSIEPFEFIKQHTDLPIYVYASNLYEYTYYYENAADAGKILENIRTLNPVLSIHSRTPNNPLYDDLVPRAFYIDTSNDVMMQKIELQFNPDYKPLRNFSLPKVAPITGQKRALTFSSSSADNVAKIPKTKKCDSSVFKFC